MTPRRGLFWPLVLIAIGVVALLANYGIVTGVSLGALLGLWPLLLVMLGLDIAFARRWPIATLAADVAIIALGAALVIVRPVEITPYFSFDTSSDCTGGQPSASAPRAFKTAGGDATPATSLALTVNGGAGRFHVVGGAKDLVDASAASGGVRLRTNIRSSGRADVRVDSCVARPFGRGSDDVEVQVASDVAASVILNAGAGDFDVDLEDVRLTDATVNAGASNLTLVLPRPSGEVPIRVSAGASSVIVKIPDGVEARVTSSGVLVNVSSVNPRLGGGNQTAGYATARERVTVNITSGAGTVTIR